MFIVLTWHVFALEEELKSPDEGESGVQLEELKQEAIKRLNEEKKTKKKRSVTKIGI